MLFIIRHSATSSAPVVRNGLRVQPHVRVPQNLDANEHAHGVTAAPEVVGEEPVVQREKSLVGGDLPEGLEDGPVRELPGTDVSLLRRHPVLARLEGHGRQRVDESRRHGGARHVGNAVPLLAEVVRVHVLELIQRGDLEDADEHGPRDEGIGTPPEGADPFLPEDPGGRVDDGRVIAPLGRGEGGIVGHPHDADLHRTAQVGGDATGDRSHPDPRGEVGVSAVLVELVPQGLEESEPRRGVHDLPEHPRHQPVVHGHPTEVVRHGPEREGLATHAGQIHPDRDRVEGVDHRPANAPPDPGRREDDALR